MAIHEGGRLDEDKTPNEMNAQFIITDDTDDYWEKDIVDAMRLVVNLLMQGKDDIRIQKQF